MWVLQTKPKPKAMKMKIKGTDLEKTQKTENKYEVSESRTEMDYQEHEEYKALKAKNSGKACKKNYEQYMYSGHKQKAKSTHSDV